MMRTPFELVHDDNNPLDMIEELAQTRKWAFSRYDEDSITMTIPCQKSTLEINMEWQDDFSALLIACSLPMEISEATHEIAIRALEQINQNLWLGHFDLSNKGCLPTFRHTLLARLIPSSIAVDIVDDILEIAVSECNRFYTTFQLIQAGDVRLQDNLHAAVFETIGEA